MLRKITAMLVVVCLLGSLTGCVIIPLKKHLELRYDVSEIISIEIFDLCDESYEIYDLEELIDNDLAPVATLTSEQYSDFADRLKEIEFNDTWVIMLASMDVDYSFRGYVVKVTYANGEYEMLNNCSQAYRKEKGHYMDSYDCDELEWFRFLAEYLKTESPSLPPLPKNQSRPSFRGRFLFARKDGCLFSADTGKFFRPILTDSLFWGIINKIDIS